jgi:hypothetical protein
MASGTHALYADRRLANIYDILARPRTDLDVYETPRIPGRFSSSGAARDGLDVLPHDGLFELVALVVARTHDRHKRASP